MKKLLLISLSLFLTPMTFAQTMSMKCTYTGVSNTTSIDESQGFKVLRKNSSTFSVVAPGCAGSVIYEDNMSNNIIDIGIQVRTSDNTIVLAVLTAQAMKLISLAPVGSSYTPTATQFSAPTGSTFTKMHTSKAPYGLAFVVTSSDGNTTAGKVNFNGARTNNVTLTQPTATYYGIVSDNTYHYLIYSVLSGSYTGTYVERRNDDATMGYDSYYGIDSATVAYEVTDYYQTPGSIIVYLKNSSGNLMKKTVAKSGFMTYYTANLSQSIGSNTYWDAARYVNSGVSVFQDKAVSHSTNAYGTISSTGSANFAAGYSRFDVTPLGSNYFIWSGHHSSGHIRVVLMDNSLHEVSSLTLSDGSSNTRHGQYQLNDTTFVIYGESSTGGTSTAKEWIIKTPYSPQPTGTPPIVLPQHTTWFWPNPVVHILNIQSGLDLRQVVITDMTGKVVENCCAYQMDVSRLAAGVYTIRYGTTIEQFIKN